MYEKQDFTHFVKYRKKVSTLLEFTEKKNDRRIATITNARWIRIRLFGILLVFFYIHTHSLSHTHLYTCWSKENVDIPICSILDISPNFYKWKEKEKEREDIGWVIK